MDAGISYCLPVGGDSSRIRAVVWRIDVLGMVLGGCCFVTSIVAFLAARLLAIAHTQNVMLHFGVMFLAFSLGVVCFARAVWLSSLVGRRHVDKRMREAGLPPLEEPQSVSIQTTLADAGEKAEERAFVAIHANPPCVQIEGLSHRYLIWPEDVASLKGDLARDHELILLGYRIGDTTFVLKVRPRSQTAFLNRYLMMQSSGIQERMAACFTAGAKQ